MPSRGFFPHRNYQPRARKLSAHMITHAHIADNRRTVPHRTAPHRTSHRTRAYQESTKSEPRAHQERTRSVPYRTYINFFMTVTVCTCTCDIWPRELWLIDLIMYMYSRGPKKVNISFPCNEEFRFVSFPFRFRFITTEF